MVPLFMFLMFYNPSKPLALYSVDGMVVKGAKDTVVTNFLNIRINSVVTNIQNEEQIIINPQDSMNMVAVWRDFRLGYRQVGFGYTFDGGNTWHDTLFAGTPYSWDSDPGITVDDSGYFYAVVLSLPSNGSTSGIFVFKSTNGGMSWEGPYTVIDAHTTAFEDKELIAADNVYNSPYRGNLYVAWTRFWDYVNGGINFSRSVDRGLNWSSPIRLSSMTTGVQWPVVTVGDSGVVYVGWLNYSGGRLELVKSYDGGETFTLPSMITPVRGGWFEINPSLLVISYPALATDVSPVSRYRGNLYVVYVDSTDSSGMDVFFRKSIDQGESWTDPVRLNDDPEGTGTDQFHPWIDVDQNGVITVIFYDRRNDPDNLLMDIYITQSYDGGETWTPNVRVTSVSSNPAALKSGLIGEYIGLDTWNGRPFMVWTDTREGSQDVYFGKDTTFTLVGESDNLCGSLLKSSIVKNVVELSFLPQFPVMVFRSDGRLVMISRKRVIDFSGYPSGFYILRAGKRIEKFLKLK